MGHRLDRETEPHTGPHQNDPEEVRITLDPFSWIPDQPMTLHEMLRVSKADECVVTEEPILCDVPTEDRQDQRGRYDDGEQWCWTRSDATGPDETNPDWRFDPCETHLDSVAPEAHLERKVGPLSDLELREAIF